jgi:type I restriction-modification system DNA methylase subunit
LVNERDEYNSRRREHNAVRQSQLTEEELSQERARDAERMRTARASQNAEQQTQARLSNNLEHRFAQQQINPISPNQGFIHRENDNYTQPEIEHNRRFIEHLSQNDQNLFNDLEEFLNDVREDLEAEPDHIQGMVRFMQQQSQEHRLQRQEDLQRERNFRRDNNLNRAQLDHLLGIACRYTIDDFNSEGLDEHYCGTMSEKCSYCGS